MNLKEEQSRDNFQKFLEKEAKKYQKNFLVSDTKDIMQLCKKSKDIREKKRNLIINLLDHSGQYISHVAQNNVDGAKAETMEILKLMTEGASYTIGDLPHVQSNIPDYFAEGITWAKRNPRGEIEVLVCASYIVSILRDDNLVGNNVLSVISYKKTIQLLETVLNEFGCSLTDLIA